MSTLHQLRARGERFMEALSREYFLAHAGHKPTAELAPIYHEYSDILGRDALELTLDAFRGARDDDARRSARQLLEWLTESQASQVVAAEEEREIEWEGSAVVRLAGGRELAYSRIAIDIANTSNRTERLAIDAARARLVEAELAPLRLERLQKERDFFVSLELAGGYVQTFETLSGVSLEALAGQCRAFLADTSAMWNDVFRERVRALGVEPREAARSDALAMMRAPQFDAYFPASAMEQAVRGQLVEMGIDPLADGRIHIDLEERPGKRSRAFCAPVRIPEEVHLVLRPHGGQSDWSTFLHEMGHALHFGYMRSTLPFEDRWVGDNSITEAYAMLLDHRVQDAGWLLRYTDLGENRVRTYLRAAGTEELHYLRRYCAKLLYEIELYRGDTSWDALPDMYAESLTAATGFRYQSADAFIDIDPRFYSSRYLRAWQLQALIADTLTEQFNEDWYRNPRAGLWITEQLFSVGQRQLAHELAERISGRKLDFAPLVGAIEKLLQ